MIVVVDYGMGNLRSVSKALEHLGGKVKVSPAPKDVEKADKLVLPGVGAFQDAVHELHGRKLFEPIQGYLKQQKPFLGICLGLQLLFARSEENPGAVGLATFPGEVRGFQSRDVKIPHMGWNQVHIERKHPLLKGVRDDSFFYFVHSYYAVPEDKNLMVGSCAYGKDQFAAILGTETLFATQFHPEKSQEAGLQILKNFLEW
jgi:glutamine amidotransferase